MDEEKKQVKGRGILMFVVRSAILCALTFIYCVIALYIGRPPAPAHGYGLTYILAFVLPIGTLLVYFAVEWIFGGYCKSEKAKWLLMFATSILGPAICLLCLYINQLLYKL